MRLMPRLLAASLLLPCVITAGACSSSSPGSPATTMTPAPVSGGTGAFGIVTINGKQKMYLPQSAVYNADSGTEQGLISVVDVGATKTSTEDSGDIVPGGTPAVPALLTNIYLPNVGIDSGVDQGEQYATATGGDSTVVIAVSKVTPTIWFIDPATDTVTGSLVLDSTYGTSRFSGGGGYVTGVAVDSAHNRAVLSVWNGYVILNLTTKSIQATIAAPPAENFGYDSVTQRIYSPFYSCTSSFNAAGVNPSSCMTPKAADGITVMTDGLQVIDLSDPTNPVYTFELPPVADGGGGFDFNAPNPNTPVGEEPDSAAVDPTTGVVVVPSEGDSFQSVIDFSKAVFDKTTLTVTAPSHIIDTESVEDLDAVAIEPNSHIALFEAEFATQVAATDLSLANAGNEAWAYASMPSLPTGDGFTNVGDPHGLAVTTALVGGEPVGFVVDESLRWIGRIDFAQIAHAAVSDASTNLDLDTLTSDGSIGSVGISPYVTYLDAVTAE